MPSIAKKLKSLYWYFRTKLQLSFKYKFTRVGTGFRIGKHNIIRCRKIVVGDKVYFGNYCHLSLDSVEIGDYTMLASRVSIIGGDHKFDMVGVPMRDTGREERKGVIIGKDCWIGHNATILDGVTIGEGSIVAAGAIVTKSVEPYALYAGIPAKKLRDRFPSEADKRTHSKSINGNYYNETNNSGS